MNGSSGIDGKSPGLPPVDSGLATDKTSPSTPVTTPEVKAPVVPQDVTVSAEQAAAEIGAAKLVAEPAPTSAARPLIGLFGGSFDPPTVGHTRAIHDLENFQLVEETHGHTTKRPMNDLKVIPVFKHYYPEKRLVMAPFEKRVRMLEMSLGVGSAAPPATGLGVGSGPRLKSKVSVSQVEKETGEVSRTYDTIQTLKEQNPNADFVLFLGADIREETHKWYRWDEIANDERVHVVFIERPGYESEGTLDTETIEISSTDVRNRVATGEDIEGMVHPRVAEFLAKDEDIQARYTKRYKNAQRKLDEQAAAQIADAQRYSQIGQILQHLAPTPGGTGSVGRAMAALETRLSAKDLEGHRPGAAYESSTDVMVLSGRAGETEAQKMAKRLGVDVTQSMFKVFSTADPFTSLSESPRGKDVVIVQGESQDESAKEIYDLPTLVVEALQHAHAARTHGAKSVTLVLPEHLDPTQHGDEFARLVATLCRATGIDNVEYRDTLNTTGDLARAGTEDASGFLDHLAVGFAQAQTLSGLLGRLESAERYYDQMVARGMKTEARAFADKTIQLFGDAVSAMDQTVPMGTIVPEKERTVVFAGGANPNLGHQVQQSLDGVPGVHHFSGNRPTLGVDNKLENKDVVIVQATRQSPDLPAEEMRSAASMLFEALLLAQGANDEGANKVKLVLPYMISARSDKSEETNANFVGAYAKLVGMWTQALDLADVTLVTPHDQHTPAYFQSGHTHVHVVDGLSLITEQVIHDLGKENLVMVTPDEGATKRTAGIAKDFGLPVLKGHKHRDGHNDKATVDSVGDGSMDVSDKNLLITDDEIGSGGTLRGALKAILEQKPRGVYVGIAHNNMAQDNATRNAYYRSLKEIGVAGVYFLDTQATGTLPSDLQGFVRTLPVAKAVANRIG